jgi:hypothetical protein
VPVVKVELTKVEKNFFSSAAGQAHFLFLHLLSLSLQAEQNILHSHIPAFPLAKLSSG